VYDVHVQEEPTITAAEIARLAGVGRAAVSNWRKRHADFPAPVGGTAASPEFDLAEVERWLRRQGKLPELSIVDRLWRHIMAVEDNPAATLAAVAAVLVDHQRTGRASARRVDANVRHLLPAINDLLGELGAQAAFDELWRRFSEPSPRRPRATPDDVADLMVGLAEVKDGVVFDPAAGSGGTLRAAARSGCTAAYGQELDEPLARLATIWLELSRVPGEVVAGDSLRADAFAERKFDAVVCHPPFGVTNWGQEELGYDPRWEFGAPPRTEPELAWVQHALAHLRPGGHAVLLMPPSAASRRAGRRIRAELLRRGALRAVVALPGGAAAPHAVSLHLWLLRRPAPDINPPARALLIDAATRSEPDYYAKVLALVRRFAAAHDAPPDEPGFARAVPVIDLLDEEVDLTPARRQPADGEQTEERLVRTRERLAAVITQLPNLMPAPATTTSGRGSALTVSIAELVRTGALQLLGPIRATSTEDDPPVESDGPAVLTVQDVLQGHAASGRAADRLGQEIVVAAGDVVVPMIARQLAARVVTDDGPLLGRNLFLLRPNPAALDPWFLAGQLRTSSNEKQASSLAGTLRFDVRRAQVRRLPLVEQRAYGATFRRLVAFESALREAAVLGSELVQLTADGLAGGVIQPDNPAVR
jgi:hypothetical protein